MNKKFKSLVVSEENGTRSHYRTQKKNELVIVIVTIQFVTAKTFHKFKESRKRLFFNFNERTIR